MCFVVWYFFGSLIGLGFISKWGATCCVWSVRPCLSVVLCFYGCVGQFDGQSVGVFRAVMVCCVLLVFLAVATVWWPKCAPAIGQWQEIPWSHLLTCLVPLASVAHCALCLTSTYCEHAASRYLDTLVKSKIWVSGWGIVLLCFIISVHDANPCFITPWNNTLLHAVHAGLLSIALIWGKARLK